MCNLNQTGAKFIGEMWLFFKSKIKEAEIFEFFLNTGKFIRKL